MASTARLVHKADFERLLAVRSLKRSTHFAVHHVQGSPSLPAKPARAAAKAAGGELSTALAPATPKPVDDSAAAGLKTQTWLGCVVPKRHAKRAVTRNLLKRQMRGSFERLGADLPAGLWLLRLSAGFAVSQFVSARSAALAQAARQELDGLLLRCKGSP
jgi:ribonuclease P protein component